MIDREEIKRRLPIRQEFERRGVEFRQSGSSLVAKCPFHEDGNPSLSLNEKDGVFFCHACQAKGSVIDAWALFQGCSATDALEQIQKHLGGVREVQEKPIHKAKEAPPTPPNGKKIVATYDYTDEEGKLLFQVVRFDPKDFRQRHPDGDGWKWGLNGTRRVIYKLPEVIASESVFFTEGEKDANTLMELGAVATTVPMGAGKWDDSYNAAFKGKKVYIFPDNDEPGQQHANLVCQKLDAHAYGVYILKVPKPHKDVTDWRNSLPSLNQFAKEVAELMRKAKAVAGADTLPIYSMVEMEQRYIEELNRPSRYTLNLGILAPSLGRAIRPIIAGEFVTVLADTGVGKTFILQNIAKNCPEIPVLMFEMELPETLMFERFASMGSGAHPESVESAYRQGKVIAWRNGIRLENVYVCPKSNLTVEDIHKYIVQSELKMGKMPGLVMIDYIGLIRGKGGSRYERLSTIAEDLKTLAKETGTIVLTSSQVSRKDSDSPDINLHDAKDSGSIENSSGLILGAWRDVEDAQRIWIKILKNTKGRPGLKVPCRFNPENLQIHEETDYTPPECATVPTNSAKRSGNSFHRRK